MLISLAIGVTILAIIGNMMATPQVRADSRQRVDAFARKWLAIPVFLFWSAFFASMVI
jgi:hypothetical protein